MLFLSAEIPRLGINLPRLNILERPFATPNSHSQVALCREVVCAAAVRWRHVVVSKAQIQDGGQAEEAECFSFSVGL